MEPLTTQQAKLRLLKLGGGFYLGWLVVGFFGFCYAALIQDFYASSNALSLSGWVAIALSLPIMIRAVQVFPKSKNLAALAVTMAKYLGGAIFFPLVFWFFTYFWLPRVAHTLLAERLSNSYTVASLNEQPAFRGCNTHYWATLRGWHDRTREKVCIDKNTWGKLKPGARVTATETVSPLGTVIHELIADG